MRLYFINLGFCIDKQHRHKTADSQRYLCDAGRHLISKHLHIFWGQRQRLKKRKASDYRETFQRCMRLWLSYVLWRAGWCLLEARSWAEWGAVQVKCLGGWPPSCCPPGGAHDPDTADVAAVPLYQFVRPSPRRIQTPWDRGETENLFRWFCTVHLKY